MSIITMRSRLFAANSASVR